MRRGDHRTGLSVLSTSRGTHVRLGCPSPKPHPRPPYLGLQCSASAPGATPPSLSFGHDPCSSCPDSRSAFRSWNPFCPARREHGSSSSTGCPSQKPESRSHSVGSNALGLRVSPMGRLERHAGLGETRNGDPLASESISALLDLEVARRTTESQGADPYAHSPDGDRESNMGRAQDPWRAPHAGIPGE